MGRRRYAFCWIEISTEATWRHNGDPSLTRTDLRGSTQSGTRRQQLKPDWSNYYLLKSKYSSVLHLYFFLQGQVTSLWRTVLIAKGVIIIFCNCSSSHIVIAQGGQINFLPTRVCPHAQLVIFLDRQIAFHQCFINMWFELLLLPSKNRIKILKFMKCPLFKNSAMQETSDLIPHIRRSVI